MQNPEVLYLTVGSFYCIERGLKRKGTQQPITIPGGTYVRGSPCHPESMSFCFQDTLGTSLCGVSICLVTAFVPEHLFKDVCSVALWGQKELFFFFC